MVLEAQGIELWDGFNLEHHSQPVYRFCHRTAEKAGCKEIGRDEGAGRDNEEMPSLRRDNQERGKDMPLLRERG
jgi:hypothetical protein